MKAPAISHSCLLAEGACVALWHATSLPGRVHPSPPTWTAGCHGRPDAHWLTHSCWSFNVTHQPPAAKLDPEPPERSNSNCPDHIRNWQAPSRQMEILCQPHASQFELTRSSGRHPPLSKQHLFTPASIVDSTRTDEANPVLGSQDFQLNGSEPHSAALLSLRHRQQSHQIDLTSRSTPHGPHHTDLHDLRPHSPLHPSCPQSTLHSCRTRRHRPFREISHACALHLLR